MVGSLDNVNTAMPDERRVPPEVPPAKPPTRLKALLLLFLASFAVRLIVAWPMLSAASWPVWDEAGYIERATAFARIFNSMISGAVDPADVERAYGRGVWPPLAPLTFALGLLVSGGSVVGARLLNSLISAATTPLVEVLTRRAAGSGAGRAAALCHLAYPGFIGFAGLLWSETLFIALLLAAVLCGLEAGEARSPARAARSSAALGACLGFALLTRAAGLPYLAALPLWLAYTARAGERLRRAALAAGVALTIIAPWQVVLWAREGRWVSLSTSTGMNLLLGQSPAEEGESGPDRKVRLHRAARAQAREHAQPLEVAARELAWEEVRRAPGAFVARSLSRLTDLWDADRHVARHLFQAVYPPPAPGLAVLVWLLLPLSLALFMGLAAWGLITQVPRRGLWLLLVVAGLGPPLLSVASPRMALPLLALLLPAAGHGWQSSFGSRKPRRALVAILLGVALTWWNGWQFRASSSYFGPAQWAVLALSDVAADREIPARLGDRLAVRFVPGGCPEIRVSPAPGARFEDGSRVLTLAEGRASHLITLVNNDPHFAPHQLTITCSEDSRGLELSPIQRAGWHEWRSCGVPGCEIYWLGGAEVSPTPFDDAASAARNGSADGA